MTAIGVAVVRALPGVFLPHILVNRLLAAGVLGLLAASPVTTVRHSTGS